jgi:hypothetical protein
MAFLNRDKTFYEAIANDCDNLLLRVEFLNKRCEMDGNNIDLPSTILNLHATKVRVVSNQMVGTNTESYVWILIGGKRGEYGITWSPDDFDNRNASWCLSVSGEGKRTIIYSRSRSSSWSPPQTIGKH